jgi:hypothetical protein
MLPELILIAKNAGLWLYQHAAAITSFGFGGYAAYRLWDDRKSRLDFTVFNKEWLPRVKIFNLGEVPILVEEVRAVLYGHGEEYRFPVNAQLKGSDTLEVAVPSELLSEVVLTADVEMSIRYRTRDGRERSTEAAGFNLTGGDNRFTVKPHFDYVRNARCPTCEDSVPMIVSGLTNEKEVAKHRKRFEKYLGRKCPDHQPVLELRAQRAAKRAD